MATFLLSVSDTTSLSARWWLNDTDLSSAAAFIPRGRVTPPRRGTWHIVRHESLPGPSPRRPRHDKAAHNSKSTISRVPVQLKPRYQGPSVATSRGGTVQMWPSPSRWMLAWAASPASPAQPSCEARNNKLKVVRWRRDGAAAAQGTFPNVWKYGIHRDSTQTAQTGLGWAGWAGLVMQRCWSWQHWITRTSDLCSADEQRK